MTCDMSNSTSAFSLLEHTKEAVNQAFTEPFITSMCISCWLIAICLMNQSPPSNLTVCAPNSLMSRVAAGPKIADELCTAQSGGQETNTHTRMMRACFLFASFLLLYVDSGHSIDSGTPRCSSRWKRVVIKTLSRSFCVLKSSSYYTHTVHFRSQVGNSIDWATNPTKGA